MYLTRSAVFISICSFILSSPTAAATCSVQKQIAGAKQFVKTIASHSAADAALIPLDPSCYRIAYLTPAELGGGTTAPVNLGVNAVTVRAELVAAASAIDAGVPGNVRYTVNKNNSITADFIQTDKPVLPRISVRQIHNYDLKTCQMSSVIAYGHSKLV